jgi:hypothetical protein
MITAEKIAQIGGGTKNAAIGLGVLLVIGVVGYVGWKSYKGLSGAVTAATDFVTTDINPVSDKNIVYKDVNDVIGCGDGSCSLGTKIYDAVQWVKTLGGS